MVPARSIIKGTFRVSIVVALAGAVFTAYLLRHSVLEHYFANQKVLSVLECASRIPEQTLKQAVNQVGLIDLSKVGCVEKQFWASFGELAQTRDGTMKKELSKVATIDAWDVGVSALQWFMVVNLAGLAFVCARTVLAWVIAGFRPKTNARD